MLHCVMCSLALFCNHVQVSTRWMATKHPNCVPLPRNATYRSFARRFASMALSRRPPALYLDGRW